jgi:hypothetical protein
MPYYTDHDRAVLLTQARQRIRFVTLAPSVEAANCRSFLALGYLQCLLDSEACTAEQFEALRTELHTLTLSHFDTIGQFDALTAQLQADPLLAAVHCTGHVDYDPASRVPGAAS